MKRNGAEGGFISLILIKTLRGPPLSSCRQLVPLPLFGFSSLSPQLESQLSPRAPTNDDDDGDDGDVDDDVDDDDDDESVSPCW